MLQTFCTFGFWTFNIVSGFEIRVSDLFISVDAGFFYNRVCIIKKLTIVS